MEGKSSYFVLLVIVACLSITLAFLAIGYFFFASGSSSEKEVVVMTEVIPSDDELSNKVIFESKNFNLKKTDSKQVAVISLSASMKHFKKVDDMEEEDITSKIDFYEAEINSAIGTYFQNLTLEDVSKRETMVKAEQDLKDQINEILTKNDKKKASPLVYSLTLYNVFYQ